MTLRVRTSIESESIVFSVSGRIQPIQVLDLKAMLESQSSDVVLDVRDVRRIDRETVLFLQISWREVSNCEITRHPCASGLIKRQVHSCGARQKYQANEDS